MYLCGPTVYNYAHIGNARPAVVFDLLARLLRRSYDLTFARNITDVDDKINAARRRPASRSRRSPSAHRALQRRHGGARRACPDIEPRATDHIERDDRDDRDADREGHAYEAEGHVLFDVRNVSRLRLAVETRPARDDRRGAGRGGTLQEGRRTTSCCGSRRRPNCRAGIRPGAAAGPAGTSSARRWRRSTSARRSTSTPAARTSCSRTTRTRSRRAPARTTARRSRATGCTTAS